MDRGKVTEKAVPGLAGDFEAVERVEGDVRTGLILLCDHARNTLPPEYGSLGLPAGEFQRHIAYDIGARDVTLSLARRLGAPAVLSTFSRLLIDPNRGEDDPTLVMRLSDGTVIPGNHPLPAGEIEARLQRFHRPYHHAVREAIDRSLAAGVTPAIFSVHSFTPSWKGVPRPWEVAILWDNDPRMVSPLLAELRAAGGLTVGDNEPYDGALKNDTMYHHCTKRGLAHALIEIRQDLIADHAGAEAWAELLEPMLLRTNRLAALHEVRHFGSRCDSNPRLPPFAAPSAEIAGPDARGSEAMDENRRIELEAAAFRRLLEHLRKRSDVQNIDMMNLAGFCRNCLANWYQDAAAERGEPVDREAAREIVYGMPYAEWKDRFQAEASAEQKAAFEQSRPKH
jgi:predicted N-formylglutamate amidohydrolase